MFEKFGKRVRILLPADASEEQTRMRGERGVDRPERLFERSLPLCGVDGGICRRHGGIADPHAFAQNAAVERGVFLLCVPLIVVGAEGNDLRLADNKDGVSARLREIRNGAVLRPHIRPAA